MFDAGFMELALILVLALVVVGPERLPKVASTVGRWLGNARRMASSLQADLEREATLQKNSMGSQEVTADIKDTVDEFSKLQKELQESALPAEHIGAQTSGLTSATHKPTDPNG